MAGAQVLVNSLCGCRAVLAPLCGAFGFGIGSFGPAWSGRPAHATPDVSIPAAISGPAACTSALRIARHPQRLFPLIHFARCFLKAGKLKVAQQAGNFWYGLSVFSRKMEFSQPPMFLALSIRITFNGLEIETTAT
ncbi:hypothetical protein OMR58_13155 [Erwinia sp. INIA-01]|uniref:hypothetical protein n=1 Tax=Erwinia sp. INIA01 TaxID=2991500 RepID=UPI00222543DD|nr:hypothetical protein [Erwinia sp. INIA01]MCW1875400.1 hypothetical protein [Erwinia sp. INIA01]